MSQQPPPPHGLPVPPPPHGLPVPPPPHGLPVPPPPASIRPTDRPEIRADLKKTRRRWLLTTLPAVVAVLVIIGYIGSVLLPTSLANSAYVEGAYDASLRDHTSLTSKWRPMDKWVDWYNAGTAGLRAGGYSKALEDFTQARELAPELPNDETLAGITEANNLPPLCKINHNLALTHEQLADISFTEGEPLFEEFLTLIEKIERVEIREYVELAERINDLRTSATPVFEEALESFTAARDIRAETACPDLTGASARLDERIARTEEILEQLRTTETPPPPMDEEPEPEEPEEEPADPGDSEGDEPEQPEEEEPADPGDSDGNNEEDPQDGEGDADPGEGESEEETPSPAEGEEDRQAELEERNRAGQQEREETEGYLGGGSGANNKPW
ncbi:hypothetical protein [Jonesia quinghaiensis]|uniref:hypothetical protein n=1 Tax=Jonesia quinghaiensis TaxID=262806 RepID=UPI00042772C0|nr:hypothetical protein [Jonesia quinghaiensis]